MDSAKYSRRLGPSTLSIFAQTRHIYNLFKTPTCYCLLPLEGVVDMTSEVIPAASSSDFKAPPTIFDPATCTRKGLCPVTQIRNQEDLLESHSLYFEVHGSGPEKVVFIMGCVVLFPPSGASA